MKNYLFTFFLLCLLSFNVHARDIGQTEITTEEGIEVFQNEKFYLLKKNVIIESDSFELSADNVKANFELFSDKVFFDQVKQSAESIENSKFISDGTTIKSEGFNITENGDIILFTGKTILILNK